ncbi:MAG: PilZ domain-containing protein [Deltaproteobacteria bacterium]|nr:PilZ domain-containing protein [Deltaproteobacteria bacterium]
MDQERRRRLRVPMHIDVSVLLQGDVIQLQTLNVSLTGILCTSSNPRFQKDDLCTVIITLNKEFQISIDSKILRVEQKETAISFISTDDESFVHLKRMLQYNIGDAERIDEELRHPAF